MKIGRRVPRRTYYRQWQCINSHLHKTFISAAQCLQPSAQIEDITPERQRPPTSRPYYQPHIQFCFLPFTLIGIANPNTPGSARQRRFYGRPT